MIALGHGLSASDIQDDTPTSISIISITLSTETRWVWTGSWHPQQYVLLVESVHSDNISWRSTDWFAFAFGCHLPFGYLGVVSSRSLLWHTCTCVCAHTHTHTHKVLLFWRAQRVKKVSFEVCRQIKTGRCFAYSVDRDQLKQSPLKSWRWWILIWPSSREPIHLLFQLHGHCT